MSRKPWILVCALIVVASFVLPAQGLAAKRIVVNHFVARPDVLSYLYVTDVTGGGPAVTITFYSMDGTLIKTTNKLVPVYGTEWIELYPTLGGAYEGNIIVESAGADIAGEYWHLGYQNPDPQMKYSVALSAQNAAGAKSLMVQHYVSDNSLSATVYLTDPVGAAAPGTVVHLDFYDESEKVVAHKRQLIPPHGTVAISPWNWLETKTVGTLYVTSTAGPITGEYWQFVNQPPAQKGGEKVWYSVAVPAVPTARVVEAEK